MLREELLKKEKICEELQRLHGFEAIIEHLYKKSTSGELISKGKLKLIMKMLEVLETGSLNEFVRAELASQHKIPELCASVINGLDVKVITYAASVGH